MEIQVDRTQKKTERYGRLLTLFQGKNSYEWHFTQFDFHENINMTFEKFKDATDEEGKTNAVVNSDNFNRFYGINDERIIQLNSSVRSNF